MEESRKSHLGTNIPKLGSDFLTLPQHENMMSPKLQNQLGGKTSKNSSVYPTLDYDFDSSSGAFLESKNKNSRIMSP